MKSSPPRKGGAQREKEGERVAYLSILVSFLGGRAHGSSLAALLRWGRGKCTVILEALNQKRERNYGNPGRMSALSLCLCPGSWDSHLVLSSLMSRLFPQYLLPLLSPSPPLHSTGMNTAGLQEVFRSPLKFGQELRIHVWRYSCHL